FREWAREFREFTTSDSGIVEIQGIFERAQPILSEFAGLFADIVRLVFAGGNYTAEDSGTVRVLRWLREEGLPWLTETGLPGVATAFEGVRDIASGIAEILGPFVKILQDAF